ncbi:Protein kinase domain containing protein [Entamoeba marina]
MFFSSEKSNFFVLISVFFTFLSSNQLNIILAVRRIYHLSKPFYLANIDDKYFIELRISTHTISFLDKHKNLVRKRYPNLFISVQNIEPDVFKPLQKFLQSEEIKEMSNILSVDEAVIGTLFDENENCSDGFWVISQNCYSDSLDDHVSNNDLHSNEIKFLTYDLLKIVQDVKKSQIPCVINKQTVVLTKNNASPFPRLMLSPLAFILGIINELKNQTNEDPLIQITIVMSKVFKEVEENKELIKQLEENQLIEVIMNGKIVQSIENLVNTPLYPSTNYEMKKTLGSGSYGSVTAEIDSNGDMVAIKKAIYSIDILKNKKGLESLKREAITMRLSEHQNIIKCVALATTDPIKSTTVNLSNIRQLENFSLVMEYCDGGNLDEYVKNFEKRRLAIRIDKKIYLYYLHFEKAMIHRDIKLENYLLIKNDPYPIVKCCDFCFTRSFTNKMETFNGTLLFVAPEIYRKQPYTPKSDLYSLGICLYHLMTKSYPFTDKYATFTECMKSKEEVKFPLKYQTDEYKDICGLITQLTEIDENKRISWEDFKKHEFIK